MMGLQRKMMGRDTHDFCRRRTSKRIHIAGFRQDEKRVMAIGREYRNATAPRAVLAGFVGAQGRLTMLDLAVNHHEWIKL